MLPLPDAGMVASITEQRAEMAPPPRTPIGDRLKELVAEHAEFEERLRAGDSQARSS